MENTTTTPEITTPATVQEPTPDKTFTRDELNKIVAAEKAKALDAARAQAETERAEAERLAGMKAEERLTHEREKAEAKAAAALAELGAYKLRAEAVKLADAEGLPAAFLDLVDFKTAKAETVDGLVKGLAKTFKAGLERALDERLRQKPPQSGAAPATDELEHWRREAGLSTK